MCVVPGQCLKHHHHWNANQSSAAGALTKNKQKLIHIYFSGDVTICMYLLPPMWLLFINLWGPPSPYQGEIISEWSLMQFSILQKNVHLKCMVYSFSRMVFNLFQGLNYQNDPFYTGCLVLLHSFFAFL